MIRPWRCAMLGVVTTGAILMAGPVIADDACQLKLIQSLDFSSSNDYAATIPVVANNIRTRMLIDTGNAATTVSGTWVRSQKLQIRRMEGGFFQDYTGDRMTSIAYIPSLQIGGMSATNVRAVVKERWEDTDVIGAIGPDFLLNYDIEIDFSAHKINFFSQDHCSGQVVYWTHDPAAAIPIRIDGGGRIIASAILDGQQVDAIIDTGSTVSAMKMSTAEKLFNLTTSSPGVSKIPTDKVTNGSYKYTFKTLSLDGINFNSPAVVLVDDRNYFGSALGPKFILGGHELAKLHIFISRKDGLLYATSATAH